jgi:two-component system LytT family response regulator
MENTRKVYIPTQYGFILEEKEHITHCIAAGSYTKIFFDNKEPILATRRLNIFQALLNENHFIRCHRSYLVNEFFIKELHVNEEKLLILQDGTTLKVACRKLKKLKLELQKNFITLPLRLNPRMVSNQ